MRNKVRTKRVRKKLQSRARGRPRLSVFVSGRHIYTQIIDDKAGKTLVSAKDGDLETEGKTREIAQKVGQLLAERAAKAKVTSVVFDRGGRKFHGRIQALAQAAREGGLKF